MGLQFRRQVVLGRYIADFFASELGVVVEIDGGYHERLRALADARRDRWLASRGYTVVHVSHELVMREPGEQWRSSAQRSRSCAFAGEGGFGSGRARLKCKAHLSRDFVQINFCEFTLGFTRFAAKVALPLRSSSRRGSGVSVIRPEAPGADSRGCTTVRHSECAAAKPGSTPAQEAIPARRSNVERADAERE